MRPHPPKDFTTAALTAIWRSAEPEISGDIISKYMVDPASAKYVHEYAKKVYPLAPRHLSVRAGFFKNTICDLVNTGHYDGLIAFGSGLSLLVANCLAQCSQLTKNFHAIEADLEPMIALRKRTINNNPQLAQQLKNMTHHVTCEHQVFNSETTVSYKDCFPQIKKPIFIIEGLIYFLSSKAQTWVFDQAKSYQHSAVVLDYFDETRVLKSQFFRQEIEKNFRKTSTAKEQLKEYLSPQQLADFCQGFDYQTYTLPELEAQFIADPTQRKLHPSNSDDYIPATFLVMQK